MNPYVLLLRFMDTIADDPADEQLRAIRIYAEQLAPHAEVTFADIERATQRDPDDSFIGADAA